MRVFVSWSGHRSKTYALYVHDWIRAVVQRAEPWMSERDIVPGQRWNEEISARLRDTHFGIICLTPENLAAPWLLFEAGAIAKALEGARVVPLLFGLTKAELTFPLAQFQAVESTREGFLTLASSINRALPEHSLDPSVLNSIFNGLWPGLSDAIASVSPPPALAQEQAERTDRDLLEELLSGVRGIQRLVTGTPPTRDASDSGNWDDYYIRGVRLANTRGSVEVNVNALEAYSSAIALMPESLPPNIRSRLFAYKGAVLKRLGRLDEAANDLALAQKWATETREINDALYNAAGIAALQGNQDSAIELLTRLFGRDNSWKEIVRDKPTYFGSLHRDPRYVALMASRGSGVGAA